MKKYIDDVEKVARNIESQDQISTDLIPGDYSDWWFDRFFQVNLAFTFKQQSENQEVLFSTFQEDAVSSADINQLALSDEYYDLIRDPEFRSKVKEVLKANTSSSSTIMVPGHEPGRRIDVTCTILDEENDQPLKGVQVELVHTDIHGLYFPENSLWNPRIFSYLFTDLSGKVKVSTIMPGRYSGDEDVLGPAHIHFTLEKEGYRMYAAEFMFEDDPVYQESANPERLPVATKNGNGRYEVTIKMQKDSQQ